MGVAKDYGCEAGGVRMKVQIIARMNQVNRFSLELNGFGGRQVATDSFVIDIAANRGEWRDGSQSFEDVVVANIASVQNVIAAGERLHGFRAQQSVSIGDDANAHANS